MAKKIIAKIIIELLDIIKGIGGVLLITPFILYWFIHGNDKRYQWIISGPYPFNSFGSGTFQLWMYAAMLVIGSIFICLSKRMTKIIKTKNRGNKEVKYVGKHSLAGGVKVALIAIMVITIGILVTLPWMITYYLQMSYHVVSSYAKTILLIMLYPCGVCGLIIENELRKMFQSLENENPFVKENVQSLRRMGFLMVIILALFIFKIVMLNTIMTMICGFACILIALFCFVLADVFQQAVQYKQDNDLTI